MSWKTEVIADRSGQWTGDGLIFKTRKEADSYVHDLMMRCTLVTGWRTVEVKQPATHRWTDAGAVRITDETTP